jgi:hypothetical protein
VWCREDSLVLLAGNPHEELAMKTITNHWSTASVILAIDLGEYKSVAYGYDPARSEVQVTKFDTTRDERVRLLGSGDRRCRSP